MMPVTWSGEGVPGAISDRWTADNVHRPRRTNDYDYDDALHTTHLILYHDRSPGSFYLFSCPRSYRTLPSRPSREGSPPSSTSCLRARSPLRFAVRRVKFNNHCAHQQTPTGRARRAAFTRILPPAAVQPPPPHLLCITAFNRRFMVVPVDAGSVSPCEDRKPRPGSSRLPLYRARRQNQAAVAVAAAAAAANHSSLRD